MTVAPFPEVIVRALLIEQLNSDQWHVVIHGADVLAGSLEGRGTGAVSFASAATDAVEMADVTGLPVLVAPYQEPVRPLGVVQSNRAAWRLRYHRSSSLDHILYGAIGGRP